MLTPHAATAAEVAPPPPTAANGERISPATNANANAGAALTPEHIKHFNHRLAELVTTWSRAQQQQQQQLQHAAYVDPRLALGGHGFPFRGFGGQHPPQHRLPPQHYQQQMNVSGWIKPPFPLLALRVIRAFVTAVVARVKEDNAISNRVPSPLDMRSPSNFHCARSPALPRPSRRASIFDE